MRDPVLVSIIVPCYNSEKYVAESIQSLLDQTYYNLEIIIVNDGSTDASENVVKSFRDARINYYSQTNKGQCAAANFGFSKSSGKYIKFYDADDVLDADVIRGQVELLEKGNEEDISFIEWRRFYNDKLPEKIDPNDLHTIHRNCTPLEYVTFTGKTPMVQCGLWLMPRTILLKSGLWDERLSLINDTEFFPRVLLYIKNLLFCETGITHYRSNFNSNSLSTTLSKKGIKSAILSIDLMAKWLRQMESSERIERIIAASYVLVLEGAFPAHALYSKIIEKRISYFPSSYIKHTKSGRMFNVVMALFGWKLAARLAKIYYRVRYNKR